MKRIVNAVLLLVCAGAFADTGGYSLQLPQHALTRDDLAVVVNDADPLSVKIADYYRNARGLAASRLIHVRFDANGRRALSADEFTGIRKSVLAQLPTGVQALALTWALPFRVDCMSITSAFTFGFDRAYCSAKTCAPTRASPWFASSSTRPFDDFGILPTMAIAATDFDQARRLIDRGVQTDGTDPDGTAYLVSTSDRARNVRSFLYPIIAQRMAGWIDTRIIQTDVLRDRTDVLFYFTGLAEVKGLDTLRFLPGAVADHLTSAGGNLTGLRQMSALRWLEAGATGSYGTVVEPCNLLAKFPNPGILIGEYTHGAPLLEAYWKSVNQPGEGLFIGEPLANPFAGYRLEETDGKLVLHTRELPAGSYQLEFASDPVGPYHTWPKTLTVGPFQKTLELPRLKPHAYRLEKILPTLPATPVP